LLKKQKQLFPAPIIFFPHLIIFEISFSKHNKQFQFIFSGSQTISPFIESIFSEKSQNYILFNSQKKKTIYFFRNLKKSLRGIW